MAPARTTIPRKAAARIPTSDLPMRRSIALLHACWSSLDAEFGRLQTPQNFQAKPAAGPDWLTSQRNWPLASFSS